MYILIICNLPSLLTLVVRIVVSLSPLLSLFFLCLSLDWPKESCHLSCKRCVEQSRVCCTPPLALALLQLLISSSLLLPVRSLPSHSVPFFLSFFCPLLLRLSASRFSRADGSLNSVCFLQIKAYK